MEQSLLAQSLRECLTPVVMVLATPAVEESCRKNNLSLLDMLHPFTTIDQIDVPVRTASDQPYRLQEFRLRLFYAADIRQPSVESTEEYLLKLVNSASEEALAELSGNTQNLETVKQIVKSESLSSWFQRYSKAFIQSVAFSDHEAIDHPVACLQAVSSRDENPISKFVELWSTDKMPALMNDGIMDTKLLKIYILIHDYQDGPADRANEILSEMRGTFDFNDCWLLCINSGVSEESSVGDEFWRNHLLPNLLPAPTKDITGSATDLKLGCLLNETDLSEISEFMAQLSCKSLLPYMEQKIRALNQQVVATRKGLRNQIKNLWWRKGKDETTDASPNSMYTISSIESQIRVLADYAFMLHDYELALSNYRLIASDYKTDKAWKYYAGVQEMIGLSLFMLDQSRKEAELSMESAFSTYQKLVASGQRYSTRCALWWAEMNKARGQYKEAANVFFRASTEEPHLRAGIFLEQSAYCYLRATPPLLRKYGFHLVLAGNRYNVCGQKKHAFRAYLSVLSIFEGQGWNFINDHVLFHLGRLSAVLGDFSMAVQHFRKLICCSHQSPNNQAAFLREFIHVVQSSNQEKLKVLKLDLPSINMESLRVQFEDRRTYATSTAVAMAEDTWFPLEAGLIPYTPSITTTWLDAASTRHSASREAIDYNECIVAETLMVDVEFTNPLQIPLNLSHVALMYKFIPESLKDEQGTYEGIKQVLHGQGNISTDEDFEPNWNANSVQDQKFSVHVAEESFTMKAGDKHLAKLRIVPYEQGFLSIMGVKWTLSGAVTGYRNFTSVNLKRNKAREKKKSIYVNPPHQRLKFYVQEHMPRLEVSLHGMPDKVNAGELHRIVLELSNTSDVGVKNFKFHSNQPGHLLVGDPKDLDAEIPSCLEAQSPKKQGSRVTTTGDAVNTPIYAFPKDVVLDGKSTLLWPLWLRAREPGVLMLNMVLYYEVDKVSGLQYRTVCISHSLQVFPSLQVSAHITPCVQQLDQYLLRLDITNQHNTESLWLRQVSCIGKSWQIAPLLPPVVDCGDKIVDSGHTDAAFLSASVYPWQLLPTGQTLSLFFQLLDLDAKDQPTGNEMLDIVSNVRLGPPSSNEPLIDITTGPLYRYYAQDRSLELKEANDLAVNNTMILESEIDVILISEQQDESSAGKPPALRDSQLLATHHICRRRVKQLSPLAWTMEGPKSVVHDFSKDPSCDVNFFLTIKNYSKSAASVKVEMSPHNSSVTGLISSKGPQGNQSGWYDISLEAPGTAITGSSTDTKVLERVDSHKLAQNLEPITHSATPYVWSSLNTFRIDELRSGHSVKYPLCVSLFAPGIYDLSNYNVSWESLPDPSDVVEELPQEEKISAATPTTWASNAIASEGEQLKAGTDTSFLSVKESITGSGCGHPLILTVEAR